jgi:signal peptidase II
VTPRDDGPPAEPGAPSTPTPARPRARWGLLAAVAATVVVLDQLTKWWATSELGDGHIVDVVWTLRLRLTRNFGSAFSLGQGRGVLISLLALVVVAVLLRSGRHATRPAAALALGLVLGGAVGNLVDRAFRAGEGFLGGGVVDFVDLQWWPVFNVADMGVVCGAALLVVVSWREEAVRAGVGSQAAPEVEAGGANGPDDAGAGKGAGDRAGGGEAGSAVDGNGDPGRVGRTGPEPREAAASGDEP